MASVMIKVIVDVTPVTPKPSGVGLYIINLIEKLEKLQSLENFELKLAYQPGIKKWLTLNRDIPRNLENFSNIHYLPLPVRVLNLLAYLPENPILKNIEIGFNSPDIYHGTNYSVYPCQEGIRVMNIYDLSFIRFPEFVTSVVRTYERRVKQCLKWTDLVLTISESSKQDIIEFLKFPEDRIVVTPLASRYSDKSTWANLVQVESVSRSSGFISQSRPYILFVSTLEPRKNIVRLISAFNALKSDLKIEHSLILVGQKGWKYKPILEAIDASPWKKDIHQLDYLSDEETALLYIGADLFVYPSLYEGFGLPVLEAMTLGCPVVTSNVSSLPEVVGDAALMVNPYDVEALAGAMHQAVGDREFRQSLIERGRIRSSLFSWELTAKETLKAYRHAL